MLGQVETTGRKNKKGTVEKGINSEPLNSPFVESNKRAFVLLCEAFALRGDSDEQVKAQALGAWSMVHGMAALIIRYQY